MLLPLFFALGMSCDAPTTYEYTTIRNLLHHQHELHWILSAYGAECFLPPSECVRFREETDRVLHAYSQLANKADLEGRLLWSIPPQSPLDVAHGS